MEPIELYWEVIKKGPDSNIDSHLSLYDRLNDDNSLRFLGQVPLKLPNGWYGYEDVEPQLKKAIVRTLSKSPYNTIYEFKFKARSMFAQPSLTIEGKYQAPYMKKKR